ncbi:MAG: tRNA (guanosine(18)-2'-O)-methyltransferase TrmH [Shewanella algae]
MSPERFARINQMLDMRQPDLSLILDRVHKSNNISAALRSADAVGIHEIHAVWPDADMRLSGNTASGSQQWVKTIKHYDFASAAKACKARGMQLVATHFGPQARDFRELDYRRPTAFIVGNERDGISAEALAVADEQVVIPMVGMVQSLNVSVASALLLYEQGHPIYAKACRRKGIPYPAIDTQGQIVAAADWWQRMREPVPEL